MNFNHDVCIEPNVLGVDHLKQNRLSLAATPLLLQIPAYLILFISFCGQWESYSNECDFALIFLYSGYHTLIIQSFYSFNIINARTVCFWTLFTGKNCTKLYCPNLSLKIVIMVKQGIASLARSGIPRILKEYIKGR